MSETQPDPRPLTIRAARAADIPLVLGLIRELAEYEQLAAEVVATEEQLRRWLCGAAPAAEVLIAERERPLGFALFFTSFSTFLGRPGLYLEDLFVRPRFRGQGVGRALLSHLARLVRERGYGRLEWSVLDWNTPAIGFYERLGARAMSEWTTYRLTGDALAALAGDAPCSEAPRRSQAPR